MSLEELRKRIKAEGLDDADYIDDGDADYIDDGDAACLQCKAPLSKHLILVSTRREPGKVLKLKGESTWRT